MFLIYVSKNDIEWVYIIGGVMIIVMVRKRLDKSCMECVLYVLIEVGM